MCGAVLARLCCSSVLSQGLAVVFLWVAASWLLVHGTSRAVRYHRTFLWWRGVLWGAVLGWFGGGPSGLRGGLALGGLGGSAWVGVVGAAHGLGLVPLVGGLYVSLCA